MRVWVGGLALGLCLGGAPFAAPFGFVSTTSVQQAPSTTSSSHPATRLEAHSGFTGGRKRAPAQSPRSSSASRGTSAPPPSAQPDSHAGAGRRPSKTRLNAYRQPVLDAASSVRPGRASAASTIELPNLLSGPTEGLGPLSLDGEEFMHCSMVAAAGVPVSAPSQIACALHQAVKELVSLRSGGSTNRREVEHRQALYQNVREVMIRAQALLPQMNPEALATVLNSLSKLPPHLLRDLPPLAGGRASPFWTALYSRMHALVPKFGPRCCATTMNALAKLRALGGPGMVPMDRVLLRRISEQCRKYFGTEGGFTTQGLSNLINGFAKIGFHPGRPWLRDFCQEVANQIDDMGPQAIANTINGLGKLKHRPAENVLQLLAARAHAILIQFNPQGLSNLLNGFARLTHPYHPGSQFLDDLRDESLWRLAGFESRGLAALAHGFSTFGHHPGELFLDSLGEAMKRALLGRNECNDEVTGWSLSTLYNGMGKLGWRPPASAAGLWDATLKWLEKNGGAARILEPQQVSQVLWSLSAMGPPAEAELLYRHLLHEAAVVAKKEDWDNAKADRQFRQVVLFCRLVGPTSLRPGATELRLALEASGRMGTGGGRECCEESDSEGSAATPNSSHFHLEVLRSVSHSLGAWDPTTEVDDGVYIQDIVLRPASFEGEEQKPLLPVIIEVDGPAHFFSNDVRRPRGDHCLKARMLKAQAGWTHAGAVSVAWFEWAAKDKDERARLIREKLERVVGEDLGAYIDLSLWNPHTNSPISQQPAPVEVEAELVVNLVQHEEDSLLSTVVSEEGDVATVDDDENVVLDADGNVRTRQGLWGLTVVELKAMLRVRGLAVSGRKAELVERLEAVDDVNVEQEAMMMAAAA